MMRIVADRSRLVICRVNFDITNFKIQRWMTNKLQNTVDDLEDNTRVTFENENVEEPIINCNKSGLNPEHRNLLHEQKPYEMPMSWVHLTEKYQRKLFGIYGFQSGVDARICFPNKTEFARQQRYEKFLEPYSLHEMVAKHKEEKRQQKAEELRRDEEVAKKMENLEKWKSELEAKIAKKEADALEAKQRKERLVEEVRRHFGFKIDPKDERFKEVYAQKEKEEKKRLKEEKRLAKEQKLMTKILSSKTPE